MTHLLRQRRFRARPDVIGVSRAPVVQLGHCLAAIVSIGVLAAGLSRGVAADLWPGETAPERVGMDRSRLAQIDGIVRASIEQKKCPGAVVLVARSGQIVWWRPYGKRCIVANGDGSDSKPSIAAEPMSRETVFDMASLTKVMATATSIMILVDRGQISLSDPVTRFVPEFGQNGKESVTVEQLLRHRGGLVADNALDDYREGPSESFERIWRLKPVYDPGSKFLYTDVGYIILGEIVRRVSGQTLDEFARVNIFEPLGMQDTTFHTDAFLRVRTAPTEIREGHWMRGEVHDPRAYLLGGVAGHAGLFSTARDVAIFANMFLCRGESCGRRILSTAAVAAMTSPGDTPARQQRGLGWDVDTPYSSIRGDLFPVGGFGHTGFTGTSLWIDPASQTSIVILTNRVHPDGKGDVRELRKRIADAVADSILGPGRPAPRASAAITRSRAEPQFASLRRIGLLSSSTRGEGGPGASGPDEGCSEPGAFGWAALANATTPTNCGIDVLARDGFRPLRGLTIGLITNHTGTDRTGRSTIDLLHAADGVKLAALFSPEHGIRGQVDAPVGDSRDEKTGLPVYSLYERDRRKPTPQQLRGLDALVFDIQDIGCRFYTYSATLGLTMEAAAENKLKFFVLDRPNPIGGELVEGPVLDAGRESFTGYHRIPVRHGMTLGELARLYNQERRMGVDLQVVQCEHWQRNEHFDATGLTWVNPSPNMRSLRQAELYPGIGLLETTNVSVGRGTDTPFEVIGAPWLDGQRLAGELSGAGLRGVVFVPVRFTPSASVHAQKECGGVQIIVTDRREFRPVRTGLAIARQLRLLYPAEWQVDKFLNLLANSATFEATKAGRSLEEIEATFADELQKFERVRASYLLY
jgi:uncharacterized protein YbbC (DUF1343 family)/CubicO group peptidase (beta-lactamase class C family)